MKKIYTLKNTSKCNAKLLFIYKDNIKIGFFRFTYIEIDNQFVDFRNDEKIAVFHLYTEIFKHNLKPCFHLEKNESNEWQERFTGNYEINI